jgi:hypothetical protein
MFTEKMPANSQTALRRARDCHEIRQAYTAFLASLKQATGLPDVGFFVADVGQDVVITTPSGESSPYLLICSDGAEAVWGRVMFLTLNPLTGTRLPIFAVRLRPDSVVLNDEGTREWEVSFKEGDPFNQIEIKQLVYELMYGQIAFNSKGLIPEGA